MTKRVIAFACAVDPLAFNVCLPPHSTLAAVAYVGTRWYLAHPESTSRFAASKVSATEDLRVRESVIDLVSANFPEKVCARTPRRNFWPRNQHLGPTSVDLLKDLLAMLIREDDARPSELPG